jgi:hypothetical protein
MGSLQWDSHRGGKRVAAASDQNTTAYDLTGNLGKRGVGRHHRLAQKKRPGFAARP